MSSKASFTVSAYCRHQGKILLINHKLHAWVPVGGHIEPNETPTLAVMRELEEEIGWVPREDYEFGEALDPIAPRGFLAYEEHDAGVKGWHMNLSFLIEGKKFDIRPCDEFTTFAWVHSLDEINGPVPENVRAIVGRIARATGG